MAAMDGIEKPDNANITGEDEFNPEFGNIVVDGLATIYNLIVTGTATIAASLAGTITPAIDNTYNFGSALLRWANAYIVALYATSATLTGLMTSLNITNYGGDGTGGIGTSTSYWSQIFCISFFVNYLRPYKSNVDIYSYANLDPVTDNTLSLGNSGKGWGGAFINSLASTTSNTVSLLASIVPGTDITYGIGTISKRLSTLYTNVMSCSNLTVTSNIGSNLIPNTGGGSYNLGNSGNPWVSAYITAFGAPTQGYAAVMSWYLSGTQSVPSSNPGSGAGGTTILYTTSLFATGTAFLSYNSGTFSNATGKTINILVHFSNALQGINNNPVWSWIVDSTGATWCSTSFLGDSSIVWPCGSGVISLASSTTFTVRITQASGSTATLQSGYGSVPTISFVLL